MRFVRRSSISFLKYVFPVHRLFLLYKIVDCYVANWISFHDTHEFRTHIQSYSNFVPNSECVRNCLYWLIDYLLFYVLLKNISLIWRRHHCRWRAAKFWPMLGARGLWASMDLYRATTAVTWGLGFSGLIWRTAPFSHHLRHAWGCGGSILTRILTGRNCLHIALYIERNREQLYRQTNEEQFPKTKE
jgi:hypothetical protein